MEGSQLEGAVLGSFVVSYCYRYRHRTVSVPHRIVLHRIVTVIAPYPSCICIVSRSIVYRIASYRTIS